MWRRSILILSFCIICSPLLKGQDLSGRWEGFLVNGGFDYGNRRPSISTGVGLNRELPPNTGGEVKGLERTARMVWELLQCGRELYGIVYFYPQDTHASDSAQSWYFWEGRLPKESGKTFTFIQGRYIDGPGEVSVYQFTVHFIPDSSGVILNGPWYKSLEATNSMEVAAGLFSMKKTADRVQSPLWLRRKEKVIKEKLRLMNTAE